VRELGNAMTYMLSARELLDLALPRMKRLAADFFEGKDWAFIGSGLSALAANLCPPACAYLGSMFRGATSKSCARDDFK
jgi:hypothetical protein